MWLPALTLLHDYVDCHLPCCCCCWLCVPNAPHKLVFVLHKDSCVRLCVCCSHCHCCHVVFEAWLGGVRCCSTHVQRAQSASLPMSTPVYVAVLVIDLYVAGICLCARLEREAERESVHVDRSAARGSRSLPRILWAQTPYTHNIKYTMFGCFDAQQKMVRTTFSNTTPRHCATIHTHTYTSHAHTIHIRPSSEQTQCCCLSSC